MGSSDFLADKMNWVSRGKHGIPKGKDKPKRLYTRYFQRRVGSEPLNFYKKCFSKNDTENKDFRTIIHYYGDDINVIEEPHGNRHINQRPYSRTM